MANQAGFTINGTPSEDASGYRGYFGTNGQTLTLKLEGGSAKDGLFEVYDPQRLGSPLASKSAPLIVFEETGQSWVMLDDPSDVITLKLPANGLHSYIVRATVRTSGPQQMAGSQRFVFEREVFTGALVDGQLVLRKNIPKETTQVSPRGVTDLFNDMVDVLVRLRAELTSNSGSDQTISARLAELAQIAATAQASANSAGTAAGVAQGTATTAQGTADSALTKASQALQGASTASQAALLAIDTNTAQNGRLDALEALPPSSATLPRTSNPAGSRPGQTRWSSKVGGLLVWDGARWVPNHDITLPLNADTVITATTLVDVAGLGTSLAAGVLYKFKFTLVERVSGLLVQSSLGLNGPANSLLAYSILRAGSSDSVLSVKLLNAFDVATLQTTLGTTDAVAFVEGLIKPTADGTLVPRARVSAGGTYTIKAGSTLQLTALGS